jgi:hypothetical protein
VVNSKRKIRSPKEMGILLQDLDSEIEEILNGEGIFHVSSYGWMDHDTIDPEYWGHAMWQTDPPFRHDFSTLSSRLRKKAASAVTHE